jgi:hypothetical protein
MKMPALMMPKNAVTASNMASILKAQRLDLTACSDAQSKGISCGVEFCKPVDVLLQQIGAAHATNR